jgi:cytochrome b
MSSIATIKTKLVMDILIAALVLALLSTSLTGLAWHEWLGLGVGTVLIVHLLLGWKWIVSITRRLFQSIPGLTKITYVVDFTLFVAMTLTIYSGLMISRVAIPALGLNGAAPNFLWRGLHSFASRALLVLVGLHLAISWNWIVSTVTKYIIEPLRPRSARTPSASVADDE